MSINAESNIWILTHYKLKIIFKIYAPIKDRNFFASYLKVYCLDSQKQAFVHHCLNYW